MDFPLKVFWSSGTKVQATRKAAPGCQLAQSVERAILDLRGLSSSPTLGFTLGMEPTLKNSYNIFSLRRTLIYWRLFSETKQNFESSWGLEEHLFSLLLFKGDGGTKISRDLQLKQFYQLKWIWDSRLPGLLSFTLFFSFLCHELGVFPEDRKWLRFHEVEMWCSGEYHMMFLGPKNEIFSSVRFSFLVGRMRGGMVHLEFLISTPQILDS